MYIKDPNLVFDLDLTKHDGSSFMSDDARGLICTNSDSVWGLQGRDFDGVDDYIEVAHDASQLLTTGGSIEAWIKPDSSGETGSGRIVDKTSNASINDGYCFMVETTRVNFNINAGTWRNSGDNTVITGDGNFYHVVVTWNATGLVTHYINGSQSGTPGISADPAGITTANAIRIGNRATATDKTFDGSIGEVRIYNRVLSVLEIQRNFIETKWRYR